MDRRPILRNGRRPIRIDEGVDRGAATGGAGWQRHCLPLSASVSRCGSRYSSTRRSPFERVRVRQVTAPGMHCRDTDLRVGGPPAMNRSRMQSTSVWICSASSPRAEFGRRPDGAGASDHRGHCRSLFRADGLYTFHPAGLTGGCAGAVAAIFSSAGKSQPVVPRGLATRSRFPNLRDMRRLGRSSISRRIPPSFGLRLPSSCLQDTSELSSYPALKPTSACCRRFWMR